MGFFRGAAVAPEPVPTENRGGIASTSSSDTRPTALSVGRRDTAGSEELDDEEEGEFNGAESTEGLFEGPRSPGGTKDSAEGGGARSPGPGGGGGSIVRSPRGSAGNSKRRSVPDRLSRKSSGWNDMFGSKQAELDEELDLESSADLPGLASYKSKFQRSKSRMVVSNPDEVTGVKVRTVNARFEPFLSRDSEGDRQESPTLPKSLIPTARYASMFLPRPKPSEAGPLGASTGSSFLRSGKSVTGLGTSGKLGGPTGKQPSVSGGEAFEKGMVLRAVAQLAALRRKSLTFGPQFGNMPASRVRRNTADSDDDGMGEDEELGAFHYSRTRVINPKSVFMTRWDIFLTLLIIVCAFTIPFEAAFLHLSLNSIFFANRVVDAIFLVDLLINFNLMFFDNEKSVWVSTRSTIAARYLRTSFTTDFLAVFPFDVIYYCWEKYSAHHSKKSVIGIMLRTGRLLKLLRLTRTNRIVQRLQTNLNVDFGVMKMIKFMASSVFISHWLACGWRLIADLESDGNNWLARLGMENSDAVTVYSTSLYFAVVSLTSTGYGDVTAVTVWEQYYVIFVLLLGSYYFGYIVGEITALVSSRSADENEFHMRMDQLNNFMEDHRLPPDLRTKLREYFRYRHTNKGVGNFHSLLSMMSKNLRAEVAGHTNGVWINKLPFFRSCPTEFVIEVSLNMESETFAPQEAIIRLNEPPEKMFVVRKGVVAGNGRIHTSGSVIGTDMLFEARTTRRAHSAMALTYCDLMSLDRKVLFQILEHYPDVSENLRKASIRTLFRTEALAYTRAVKLAVALRNQEVKIDKETFEGQPNGERIKFYLDKLVVLLRKDQEEMDRLKDATLKIQSIFRGHRVRKKYKNKLRRTVGESLAKAGPVLLTRLTPESASSFKPPVPVVPAAEGDFVRLEETVERLQRQVYASSNRHQKQMEATRVALEKQLAVSSREIQSRLSNLMDIIRKG